LGLATGGASGGGGGGSGRRRRGGSESSNSRRGDDDGGSMDAVSSASAAPPEEPLLTESDHRELLSLLNQNISMDFILEMKEAFQLFDKVGHLRDSQWFYDNND